MEEAGEDARLLGVVLLLARLSRWLGLLSLRLECRAWGVWLWAQPLRPEGLELHWPMP